MNKASAEEAVTLYKRIEADVKHLEVLSRPFDRIALSIELSGISRRKREYGEDAIGLLKLDVGTTGADMAGAIRDAALSAYRSMLTARISAAQRRLAQLGFARAPEAL